MPDEKRWFILFLGHLDPRNLLINNCGYDSLVDEALLLYTNKLNHKYRDGAPSGCFDNCMDVSAKDLLVSVILSNKLMRDERRVANSHFSFNNLQWKGTNSINSPFNYSSILVFLLNNDSRHEWCFGIFQYVKFCERLVFHIWFFKSHLPIITAAKLFLK